MYREGAGGKRREGNNADLTGVAPVGKYVPVDDRRGVRLKSP